MNLTILKREGQEFLIRPKELAEAISFEPHPNAKGWEIVRVGGIAAEDDVDFYQPYMGLGRILVAAEVERWHWTGTWIREGLYLYRRRDETLTVIAYVESTGRVVPLYRVEGQVDEGVIAFIEDFYRGVLRYEIDRIIHAPGLTTLGKYRKLCGWLEARGQLKWADPEYVEEAINLLEEELERREE